MGVGGKRQVESGNPVLGPVDKNAVAATLGRMSIAEIKREVDRLSEAELRELESYLRERVDKDLSARRERVSAIMHEMDTGRKYSRGDLGKVDRDLTERGL